MRSRSTPTPTGLDLDEENPGRAVAAPVRLTIDSDPHAVAHFGALDYGIAVACRGWVEAKSVLNTPPLDGLLRALRGDHGARPTRRRR